MTRGLFNVLRRLFKFINWISIHFRNWLHWTQPYLYPTFKTTYLDKKLIFPGFRLEKSNLGIMMYFFQNQDHLGHFIWESLSIHWSIKKQCWPHTFHSIAQSEANYNAEVRERERVALLAYSTSLLHFVSIFKGGREGDLNILPIVPNHRLLTLWNVAIWIVLFFSRLHPRCAHPVN